MAFPFVLGAERSLTAVVREGAGKDALLSVGHTLWRFAGRTTSRAAPIMTRLGNL